MVLQPFLPDHHIGSDSKDAVKLGAGLIATMAALILGLLVASTKNSFDATLSIAGAIFLIHEMSTPMDGLIKVSSHNVHKALKYIAK